MDADVEHLEFEHTPGNHRPFMLTAFADGQAVQLWFTEQQISEIWDKAMAPLMAYRAAKSTPFLGNVITTSFSPLSIMCQLWLVQLAGYVFQVRQDEWPRCEVFGWLENLDTGAHEWAFMGRCELLKNALRFIQTWLGIPDLMVTGKFVTYAYQVVLTYKGEVWCEFRDHPGRFRIR